MAGQGNAVGAEGEEAVGFGLAEDGVEGGQSGVGEGAGEIGEGEAVVGAEAEEEGLFKDGLVGELVDGGGADAVGENGQGWWRRRSLERDCGLG